MKYWRGYLVAAIIAACAVGLSMFAEGHVVLVDMIYPAVSRMVMEYMAAWSGGTDAVLWQVLLVAAAALLLCSFVLMIVLRWNPVQWFGWVLTAVSVVFFLHTGLYGLNAHAGPIAEDLRLEVNEPSATTMEAAAAYYRDKANALAKETQRQPDGTLQGLDFETLAAIAGDGFNNLTYEETYPIFSGSLVPVKAMGWQDYYTARGITGMTVALTGESCVNTDTPAAGLPFVMCREMAHRMAIYPTAEAEFAAFLACRYNSSTEFQYSAYLMAYRACRNALASLQGGYGKDAVQRLDQEADLQLLRDIQKYEAFLGENGSAADEELCKLFVSWHIQQVVVPQQEAENEVNKTFDPMDETDERLQDIVNGEA